MTARAPHRGRRRLLAIAGSVSLGLTTVVATADAAAASPAALDTEATVVVGMTLEPTNLDILNQAGSALEQVLLDNVYETLLRVTRDGEILPGLADYEVSDDGLVYTFSITEGVTFHDGQELTSADVVWSLEQHANAHRAAVFASVARLGDDTDEGDVDETDPEPAPLAIEALDDYTVELTLTEPDNELPWNLAQRGGAVLAEGAAELENTANGTGPFMLDEWRQGSSIGFVRNDDYHGEAPAIAEVVFEYFGDPNAKVAALRDGDIDVATAVDTELLGEFEGDDDFVIDRTTSNGEFTLGMNLRDDVLSDHRVRQAITHAIDKNDVVALADGYATAIGGPVPPHDPWYDDAWLDVYPYDPDLARELLDEAGYGDGLEMTFIVPNHYPANISDYVVSQLADVGIVVELRPVEFPTWLEQVYTNNDYELTMVLHAEPRDIDNYANPDYYWGYDNPEVQQLMADAKTAPDPDDYVTLIGEAVTQIVEDAPTVWLSLADSIIVARAGVGGLPDSDVNSRFDASGLTVEA